MYFAIVLIGLVALSQGIESDDFEAQFLGPHGKNDLAARATSANYAANPSSPTSAAYTTSSGTVSDSGGEETYDYSGGAGYSYGELNEVANVTSDPLGNSSYDDYDSISFNFSAPITSNSTTTASTTTNSSAQLAYTNIEDITGSFELHTGNDSNLYLSAVDPTDASGLYAGINNIYMGDANGNLFIYYSDEMQALNVSRFRLVADNAIPEAAQLVSLAPIQIGDEYIYAAVDSLANGFYLAGCNIQNGTTKVFLVTNPTTDLEILTQPDLAYIVTGGVVTGCSQLSLAADGAAGST